MSAGSFPTDQLSLKLKPADSSGSQTRPTPAQVTRGHLLVGPEDLVGDFTEEDLLVRPQVRRRSLSDEGFSVEERHL